MVTISNMTDLQLMVRQRGLAFMLRQRQMLASCCLLRQAARNIKSGATYPSICGGEHIDGYNQLYEAQRKPAPILEAACWSHGRRKFVDLVKQGEAPIVSEAVRRIDMLFEIERSINGQTPAAHCRP
jgi:hypothetical protein